ncbi:MAG: hypothetical protein HYT78_04995, partial [Deltaproteobacteria bacterium]|nr:hypothetical protein [Deltaproteobacteria bacterium]
TFATPNSQPAVVVLPELHEDILEEILGNVVGESVVALQDGINQPLVAVNEDVGGNRVTTGDAFDQFMVVRFRRRHVCGDYPKTACYVNVRLAWSRKL